MLPHCLELLSPAKTALIGKEAILHGADAVYIGGASFGARHHAGNSIESIEDLTTFAHRYRARIFVTLNTILHEAELEAARTFAWQCYHAGVDALIIQDMAMLEMADTLDFPPIQLHASTQCDIRTPQKARFLADSGLSQLVLARELSLPEIKAIHQVVPEETILEYFIHGALCVAFSGQCYISHAQTGRSANRGECSQACRLPYTLKDEQGRVVAFEKHLLSLKDNNQSTQLEALIDAGIRSFKIEGRYKEAPYVKNMTAHYRQLLDAILEKRPEFSRSSCGKSHYTFQPNPEKTFHRGSTTYFSEGRKIDIGAFDSPKFIGVPLGEVVEVQPHYCVIETTDPMSNGDGLTYLYKREMVGIQANVVEPLRVHSGMRSRWKVFPNDSITALKQKGLKIGVEVYRNRDHAWEAALLKPSATRKIDLTLHFFETTEGFRLHLKDEDQIEILYCLDETFEPAAEPEKAKKNIQASLSKLGQTLFNAHRIDCSVQTVPFIPVGTLNAARREAIEQLEAARLAQWTRLMPKAPIQPPAPYPDTALSYLGNVYNSLAYQFYQKHGVQAIEWAYEAHQEAGEVSLMITKHCLRYAFNLCPKQAKGIQGVMGQIRADPMMLVNGKETLTLRFECRPCEMHVMGTARKSVLKTDPPSSVPVAVPLPFPLRKK